MSTLRRSKRSVRAVNAPGSVSKQTTEIDVTEGLRELVIDDDHEHFWTPQPGSPAIIVTSPSDESLVNRQRLRQSSTEAISGTPRPKLKRKAATAPAGALHLYSGIKPQPPRRAISARLAHPGHNIGSRLRRTPMMSPPLSRLSHIGIRGSRSIISRRKTNRKSVGKLGLKPKINVWRMSPPPQRYQLISEALNSKRKSFSEKARVRETLKMKKLEVIYVDHKSKESPGSPNSMVATPRELYGVPESDRATKSLRETQAPRRDSLLPISPQKAKHFSMPLTPDIQRRGTFKRSSSITNIPKIRKTVYMPGQIKLEEKNAATPRRGSIATMEPFDNGTEPKAKRFSDMVALDGIVMFFQGLGVAEESTEEGLDRFWVPDTRANRHPKSSRKPVPLLPSGPFVPSLPSSRSALFSSRGLLQDEKRLPPSPGTPGRRRPKLRQLWKSSRSII